MVNKVILIGNLASDPELKKTASDIPWCTFRIAVQRRFANQQGVREADFFPIIAWRQTAELCARFLTKGRKCAVVGQLQTRSYDAQDGTKRYVTEIIVDEHEFCESRGAAAPEQAAPAAPSAPAAQAARPADSGGYTEVDDDELPF